MKKLATYLSWSLVILIASTLTFSCSGGATDSAPTDPGLITENHVFSSLPINILFVVDNSGNINNYTTRFLDSAGTVLSVLSTKSYQFRCAVTTTDAYKNTASQTEFSKKSGEAIITPQTSEYLDKIKANLNTGINGSGTERALESMRFALSSSYNQAYTFPASGSFFAVIFFGNEDDLPATTPVADYVQYLTDLTGTSPTRKTCAAYSLSVLNDQTRIDEETVSARISELCSAFDGFTYDIHDADYAPFFTACANATASIASPISLGSKPDTTTLRVTVNGLEVAQSSIDGWQYDEAINSVLFKGSSIPSVGASVKISYIAEP